MSDDVATSATIASLRAEVDRLTNYNQRLLAENVQLTNRQTMDREEIESMGKRNDSLTQSIITACTGSGCLNAHELRQALDTARERAGVLEAEVRAARKWERQLWIDLEGVAKPQPPFLTGPMRELTEARRETDRTHALDAAKFGGAT